MRYRPGKTYRYLQVLFVLVFLAAGFLLLLHPEYGKRLTESQRTIFGILLLVYGGYRAFVLYKLFQRNDDHR